MFAGMLAFSAAAVEKADMTQGVNSSISGITVDCFFGFSSKKIKSIVIPVYDTRLTKLSPDAVLKVYHYPDESIKMVDLEVDIPEETTELLKEYWSNPEEYAAQGKVNYVGQVSASKMYFGEGDYRPMSNFPNTEKFNSIHVDLRSLNVTENYGDYAFVLEEGSLTSDDNSVINNRLVVNDIFNYYGDFNMIMKMSYTMFIFFCVFNFKYITKGY
jgi:hypothetical protein